LKIVIAVDLILGPLLTFCVFRISKPGLALDMSLIAAMQLVGFFYGSYIIHEARPLALVFVREAFYVLSADLYEKNNIPFDYVDNIRGDFPKQIVVDLMSLDQARKSRQPSNSDAIMILEYEHYRSLEQNLDSVLNEARYVNDRLKDEPEFQLEYDDFFKRNGGVPEDYAFLPVYSRYKFQLVAVRIKDKRVVDTLRIRYPYPNELPTIKRHAELEANKQING
jgi:hypothetical protein